MSRFFSLALACMLSVVASTAQATVLSSFLTFDGPVHHTVNAQGNPFQGGGEDFLQDDSVSAYDDRGAQGFGPGDVVWGVMTLSEIDSSGQPSLPVASPNQIAIVFSVQLGAPIPGVTNGFTNLPIGNAADPLDLRNLLAGSPAIGHINDNTVAIVLSSSQADLPSEDPINFSTANFTANFASGIWEYEVTADLIPNTDDFFHFVGDLTGGLDAAALTITDSAFGAAWLPVDVRDFAGIIHFGDVTLDRGRVDPASQDQQARGWFFRDDSSLFVNAVPEPGSMAVFGLLGVAGILRARRNKK